MKEFLTNLVQKYAKAKYAYKALTVLIIIQIFFILGNNFWPDFARITKIMPDLNPGYSPDQLKGVLDQFRQRPSAVFGVYFLDLFLPASANLLLISVLSLLINYRFKSFNFLAFLPLLLPIINITFDYFENIIIILSTLINPATPPAYFLTAVTNIKMTSMELDLLAVVTLAALALNKKLRSKK